MRKVELLFFSGTGLFCGLYLLSALGIPFGNVSEPGPGFLPRVLGVLGLLVSAAILLPHLAKKAIVDGNGHELQGLLRVGTFGLAIAVFIAIWSFVGAYPCIFFLMMALSKISGLAGWFKPVILSAAVSIVSLILFDLILGVPLPLGFFEGAF